MQYFDVIISFLAIISLCVFFAKKCNINSALTPLLSIAVIILWFSAAGVANILQPAGYLFFAINFALGIYAFIPQKNKQAEYAPKTKWYTDILTPGFLFFIAAALFFIIYFAVRKPIFGEWDELSLWGTASKLMKINNQLYTTADVAWDWIPSQLPGLISLGYYTQFFGAAFAPWKVFVGYDLLFFAMYAAALAAFPRFKKYSLYVPMAIIGVLTPYLITVYTRIVMPSNIYMCSYGDIPSGLMFGGALAWYFSYRHLSQDDSKSKGAFGIFIILAAAGLLKDNTFVIQLVAAGIIAVDMLVFGTNKKCATKVKEILKRVSLAVLAMLSPLTMYFAWNRYIVYLASLREAAGQVGTTSLPLTVVVKMGFEMLFNVNARSQRFTQALNSMLESYFTTRLGMLGTGFTITLIILAIFVLGIIFSADKRHRRRTSLVMGLSALGFAGYYWVLILSYAFIFREAQAAGLESYNRYVYSYYLGWFFIAVVMLAIGAVKSRPFGVLKGMLLCLSVLVITAVSFYVRPTMSVIAYPESTFYQWRTMQTKGEQVKQILAKQENDGKVFFVSQNDNGLRFFTLCYELLPYQMDFSFGGGRTGPAELNDSSVYYHDNFSFTKNGVTQKVNLDKDGLALYLTENECEYILFDELDSIFINEYADLFTDKLIAAQNGTLLYKRVQIISDGTGSIMYAPCTEKAVQ